MQHLSKAITDFMADKHDDRLEQFVLGNLRHTLPIGVLTAATTQERAYLQQMTEHIIQFAKDNVFKGDKASCKGCCLGVDL